MRIISMSKFFVQFKYFFNSIFSINYTKNIGATSLVVLFMLLLSHCNSNSPQKNSIAANINAKLGLAYLKQHNIQLAKYKILLALEQAPHNSEILDVMAYYLEKTGNTQQAEYYY